MFENLKGLLGEAYHDGITAEEVNNFFAGKNFADLSTGQYVDKNKLDETKEALDKASSFIRTKLASRIEIRHTPELKFIYDTSIAYGEHIDEIIEKIKEEEK